jgi:uncharacterized caspase-like protein
MKKMVLLICMVLMLAVPVWAAKQSMKVGVTPVPPSLTATVSFSDPSGNNILDAGETGKLIVTVKNTDKGTLFKNISPSFVKVKKEYQGPKNAVLITSSAADQVSTWYEEKRHSLFTYYFLKGLQGAADERGDGKITVAEMDAYLKKNVPYMAQRLGGNEQTPVITGNAGEVIAILKKN